MTADRLCTCPRTDGYRIRRTSCPQHGEADAAVLAQTDDRPDTGLDVAAWREVAEAATPGPWQVLDSIHRDPIVHQVGRGFLSGGGIATAFHGEDYGRANAAYIATFDPPTVLALLAAVERLTAERDRARGARRTLEKAAGYNTRRAEAAEADLRALRKRVARVEALLDLWESWDGARPHPGESSPRQREQLRAALDGER